MGLFDEIVSGVVKGVAGQAEAALPGVLTQVLGQTNLGSIGGLLTQLQQSGLGSQVSSWLGNGANLHVSADQLRAALGNEQLQQMARSAGLPVDQLLALLSQHLPQAVDNMSPNGKLEAPPAGGSLGDQAGLGNLKR